jgi:hypothetical protein
MITLTKSQFGLFARDACKEIEKSHDDSWRKIHARKPPVIRSQWEAWFVAHLCAAMCDVAKAWQPRIKSISSGAKMSVSSVFTHQSAYVKWKTGRCELADLLIAFIDRKANSGYATLIQAKQGDGSPAKLTTKSEKLQFQLLSARPIFDVDAGHAPVSVDLPANRSGHDEGILYGVNPPKDAAKNPPPWGGHLWKTGGDLATAPVPNQVSLVQCLAKTLVEQFQGDKGWDFALPPTGKDWRHFAGSPRDDWAMVINYLLETTFKKPLKTFQTVIHQSNRGRDVPMFLQTHSGKPLVMSFYHYGPEDFEGGMPLDWIHADEDGSGWAVYSNSPLYEIGNGGSGGGGDNDGDEYLPENGPISAIVFEFEEGNSPD